jgi:uncharacterized protein HemX
MAEVEETKPEDNPESVAEEVQANPEQAGALKEEAAPVEQPADVIAPPSEPPVSSGRKMALIAIVVMVLALGAVVAGIVSGRRARLARQREREVAVEPTPTPAEEEDVLLASYEQISDSDEIADIESDLAGTSFERIDAELTDIDSELSAED